MVDKEHKPPLPEKQHAPASGSDIPPPPPGLDIAWVDKGYTIPAERNIPQKKRG